MEREPLSRRIARIRKARAEAAQSRASGYVRPGSVLRDAEGRIYVWTKRETT